MSFGERGYKHGVNVVDMQPEGTVTLTPVEYVPLRTLLTIPQKGTATPDEAVQVAKSLAKSVEVRLGEHPDSTPVHSIKESFEDRAAILCIIRNMNSVKYNHEELDMKTEEQLRQLDPLVMVKSIYKSRNGGEEMPQALVDKFNTAVKIAKENEEEE